MTWRFDFPGGRRLAIGPLPVVMGVLNVTHDSFSDGGLHLCAEEAVAHALQMVAEGAVVIDVGGESTRPRGGAYGDGAFEVPEDEELRRVVPVIERLRSELPSVIIGIDTRKPAVARAALEGGADLVNSVLGLERSEEMANVIVRSGAPVILNHCRGTPASTFEVSRFTDVVSEVTADLEAARDWFAARGVPRANLWLDPGLGFGKSASENFSLLAHLEKLGTRGRPVVVGASRKAFLGSIAGKPPRERLAESLGAVAVCARFSGSFPVIARVHDVSETVRMLAVLERAAPGVGAT